MSAGQLAAALTSLREGVGIALDALRANKVRAGLTILGVAIGVMVVVAMAGTINGINQSVAAIFEQTGPKTFYVFRFWRGGVEIDEENPPWRRNPPLTNEEGRLLGRLPSIRAVSIDENGSGSVHAGRETVSGVEFYGRNASWLEVMGGDVRVGRNFTPLEEAAGDKVVVLNEKLAGRLFGEQDPLGRKIRLSGQEYRVAGVYTAPPNLFTGPPNRLEVFLPYETFRRHVPHFPGWAYLTVKPTESATVGGTIDEVTAALRRARGLRPGQENTFNAVTQDVLLEAWESFSGAFFVVMLGLSSVALMVGGVGVIAIMMISVTERTREIGVRKALGATRREILWQFLVEAATLTVIGGAAGLALGGGISRALASWTPIPSNVPAWSVAAALLASVLTGMVFGIVPANRAARLDPVEALRYE